MNHRGIFIRYCLAAVFGLVSLIPDAHAGPVYQPPGANLTLGDVSHGLRVQSASGNPAAAAADVARGGGRAVTGTVLSVAGGLEYGNVQELFDFYDRVTKGYKPSDPGDGGGGPGQDPDDKPDGGISIGDVLDMLDPEFRELLDAVATEVATQTALVALIRAEGYGKAWVSADAPFVVGREYLGGAWTFGVNWSGSTKAYGFTQTIDFDRDAALEAIRDWVDTLPIDRPEQFAVSDDILLTPTQNSVLFAIANDSSIITKSTQTTDLNVGYSRPVWSGSAGTLFAGAEAHLYLKRLSRLSVRFGDVTDSEELFELLRDADYKTDEGVGFDLGVLWVAENYQLGAQVTNVNEPKFVFPDVNIEPYRSQDAIEFLNADGIYRMDRQLKLEGSLFGRDRRWSAHLGVDTDPATDPMGDRFQWATLSAGVSFDNRWLPNARIGLRRNLAGTEKTYASLGVTAFGIFNVDIASALDTVRIDGQKLPQGLMASIGFQIAW